MRARRVEFFLPGAPLPAPRPRFRVIHKVGVPYNPRKAFVSTYYDKKYATFLAEAPKAIRNALNGETIHRPFESAVQVVLTFHIERPKSTKRSTPRYDIDNYMKSIFDAMTKAEVWTDDDLVAHVRAAKVWANEGLGVGTHVMVGEVDA